MRLQRMVVVSSSWDPRLEQRTKNRETKGPEEPRIEDRGWRMEGSKIVAHRSSIPIYGGRSVAALKNRGSRIEDRSHIFFILSPLHLVTIPLANSEMFLSTLRCFPHPRPSPHQWGRGAELPLPAWGRGRDVRGKRDAFHTATRLPAVSSHLFTLLVRQTPPAPRRSCWPGCRSPR